MNIENLLKGKNGKDKAQLKSKELAKVKISNFKEGNFDIEIIGDIKEIDGGIELFAKAFLNGKQLGFGKKGDVEIERFRFFNPPVLVDDVNGEIVREWKEKNDNKIVTKQRKLKYDTERALKSFLTHTISLVGKNGKDIKKGKIGNTTSTFYPDAGHSSTTVDGELRQEDEATWTAAQGGAGDSAFPDTTTMRFGSYKDVNGFTIYRSILTLNTAAIPDDDVISLAKLSLYTTTKNLTDDDAQAYLTIVASAPANNNNLVAGDFNSLGTTKYSADINIGDITESAYNDFIFNATGILAILKTGITKLGGREGHDLENQSIATGESVNWDGSYFSTADETGTTQDPKLIVEHAPIPKGKSFAQII